MRLLTIIRYPLMGVGMLCLLMGMVAGVLRLGFDLPEPVRDFSDAHGPLMVCGFLGTVIGLERAVALGRWWAYTAPLCMGAGGLSLVFGAPSFIGMALFVAGSVSMVVVSAVALRLQPMMFVAVMGLGAAALLAGNVYWLTGRQVYEIALWWAAFVTLTIAGERLDLSRFSQPSAMSKSIFYLIIVMYMAGVVTARFNEEGGVRLAGAGMIGIVLWLSRFDIARKSINSEGMTRFIGACVLSGYFWLGAGGAIGAITGHWFPDTYYDAILHSIFLGFAFSMIFGHAPIIFPSVVGIPVTYHPIFYLHMGLLHVTVAVRVIGDITQIQMAQTWGALGNLVVIVIFIMNTAFSVIRSRTPRR